MRNAAFYPARSLWQVKREEALVQADYRCQMCGLPDASEAYNERRPHPFYEQGTPYRVYLQLAHQNQYETWKYDAEALMLCPSCHGKFDRQHRRKKAFKHFNPVGLVVVWVWYKGERCLAAEARVFDDLFAVVASFSAGLLFEIEAEMLMNVVGKGRYRRTDLGVEVVRETGTCRAFGALLQDILSGVYETPQKGR